jgi:hypothetical protein
VGEAEIYLKKAEECREQSGKSPYPVDKASWLRLADQWTKRAHRSEAQAAAAARAIYPHISREKISPEK